MSLWIKNILFFKLCDENLINFAITSIYSFKIK